MGEGMGFPGTDADTGATAARGCNALLMNTKNFIKDCLYIKLSTKLCPITPVAPFHAWKLLAAGPRGLFHLPILHHSLCTILGSYSIFFVHVSIAIVADSMSRMRCRRVDREMPRKNEGSSIDSSRSSQLFRNL